MNRTQPNRWLVSALLCAGAISTGCGGENAKPPPVEESAAPKPTTLPPQPDKPKRGTGSGSLTLGAERFEFALSECTLKPFKLGLSNWDFQLTGAGTTADGSAFKVTAHRADGSDGRRALTRQTFLIAVESNEPPMKVPGSDMVIPTRGRVLESTLYFNEETGWEYRGRKLEGDHRLYVEDNALRGSIRFDSKTRGQVELTCDEPT